MALNAFLTHPLGPLRRAVPLTTLLRDHGLLRVELRREVVRVGHHRPLPSVPVTVAVLTNVPGCWPAVSAEHV